MPKESCVVADCVMDMLGCRLWLVHVKCSLVLSWRGSVGKLPSPPSEKTYRCSTYLKLLGKHASVAVNVAFVAD